jgi:hypothetical protein
MMMTWFDIAYVISIVAWYNDQLNNLSGRLSNEYCATCKALLTMVYFTIIGTTLNIILDDFYDVDYVGNQDDCKSWTWCVFIFGNAIIA